MQSPTLVQHDDPCDRPSRFLLVLECDRPMPIWYKHCATVMNQQDPETTS
ncbi:MAG: hypothetical protein AB4042_15710 [Leptolyngbyaceae cyanobacterium]